MSVRQLQRPQSLSWTFGDRLRKVRRVHHLTQLELADAIGKSAKAIDAWESDRNRPRDLLAVAQLIEERFGLPRGWMLGYADGPHVGGHQVNVAGAGFEPATSGLRAWNRPEAARPALIIPFPRRSQTLAVAS